jgi:pectate lyase
MKTVAALTVLFVAAVHLLATRAPLAPELLAPALYPAVTVAAGDTLAFVGAEGYGATATWGSNCERSGANVIFVTNTNNNGAGSLFDAVENQTTGGTMDYVIFRTGGTVTLTNNITLTNSCVYIAGQTAPGGGFQVKPINVAGINAQDGDSANHYIIRYLRIRPDNTIQRDAVSMWNAQQMIWDHTTVNFGTDESWSINNCFVSQGCTDANYITLQWSIIGPTLTPHSTNSLIKGSDDGSTHLTRLTLHHNLYTNATVRSPRMVACDTCQVINNVTYNWESWVGGIEPGEGNNPCRFDFVRNYWKSGPWTGGDTNSNIRHDDLTGGITLLCRIYALRNISDDFQTDSTADQKNLFKFRDSENPLPDSIFEASAFGSPAFPVTQHHAVDALSAVLDSVGPFQQLACNGTWTSARDALDTTLIDQATNGTGPSNDAENDDIADHGGIPTLAVGTPCDDADGDGMPDAFEDLCLFDKNNPNDYDDVLSDGYIKLERYLNGDVGRGVTVKWTDNSGNETGFEVQRDTGAGYAVLDSVAANVVVYYDPDGLPKYKYKVGAYNATGKNVSGELTVTCN